MLLKTYLSNSIFVLLAVAACTNSKSTSEVNQKALGLNVKLPDSRGFSLANDNYQPIHLALSIQAGDKSVFSQNLRNGQEVEIEVPFGDIKVTTGYLAIPLREGETREKNCQDEKNRTSKGDSHKGERGDKNRYALFASSVMPMTVNKNTETIPVTLSAFKRVPMDGVGLTIVQGNSPLASAKVTFVDPLTQKPIIEPCTNQPLYEIAESNGRHATSAPFYGLNGEMLFSVAAAGVEKTFTLTRDTKNEINNFFILDVSSGIARVGSLNNDFDGDGIKDADEIAQGTNPRWAPPTFKAVASQSSDGKFKIFFDNVGDGYEIKCKILGVSSDFEDCTRGLDKSLTSGTSYEMEVAAVDGEGFKVGPVQKITFTAGGSSVGVVPVTVGLPSSFPVSATRWNDYVKSSDNSSACVGTETSYSDCINAGEIRRAVLTGDSSCSGISANDSLDALHWICEMYGNSVVVRSTGLKPDKRLSDLIDTSSLTWRPVSLSVYRNGSLSYQSEPSVWWTNSFGTLNTTSGTTLNDLNNPYRVYVAQSSISTYAVKINADGVAVVVPPQFVVTSNGDTTNNCPTSGVSQKCLIYTTTAGAFKYLWIEGRFNSKNGANRDSKTLLMDTVSHGKIRYFYGQRFGADGLYLNDTKASMFRNMRLDGDGNATSAVYVTGSSQNNIFSELTVSNTTGSGAAIVVSGANSNYNMFSRVLVANAGSDAGVKINADSNIFHMLTAANTQGTSYGYGIFLDGTGGRGSNSVVSQYVSGNNFESPLKADIPVTQAVSNFIFDTAALVASSSYGLKLNLNSSSSLGFNVYGSIFKNSTNLPDASLCYGTGSGLSSLSGNAVGNIANCNSGITISNTLTSAASTQFQGKVTSSDSASSYAGTSVAQAGISDWSNFDNMMRSWGPDPGGNNWDDPVSQGNCSAANCVVYDYRPGEVGSSDIRNANGAPSSYLNTTCAAAVSGSAFVNASVIYLRHAVEVLEDGAGNDNGLCESNENCIYQPNMGAYLGKGDFWQNSCAFTNGTISNVKMYMYPSY